MTSSRERTATAIALLAALPVLALFPLPFWLGIGVMHWHERWQEALLACVATVIALAAVFVVVRVHRAIAPPGSAPVRGATSVAEYAARHAADLARIEADPALHHWLPLARRMMRFDAATVARYEARYRELLARPNGRWYADRLLAGDWIGDPEIAYREDPSRLVTCEHLRPIERDLRRAEIRGVPASGMNLWSAAYLDLRELRPRYALDACVREEHTDDHPHSPGQVFLRCDACGSSIESGGSERLQFQR